MTTYIETIPRGSTTGRAEDDREGCDRRLEGLARRHLSGTDHGERRADGGIEADLFFTFFGLDAIRKERYEKIKVATVGNPGMHLPTWLGALPGLVRAGHEDDEAQMEKLDIPPIPEFMELVADSGAGFRLQGDGGHVRADDGRLHPAVDGIIRSASSTSRPRAARSSSRSGVRLR